MPFGGRSFAKGKKGKKEKKVGKGKEEESDEEESPVAAKGSPDAPAFNVDDVAKRMDAHVDSMLAELAKLRTNRASPGMLESILVQAYGDTLPLKELAIVTVKDNSTLTVSLFDASMCHAVEKAIQTSALGLNPKAALDTIIVSVPSLSAEDRKEVAKLAAAVAETAKIAVRGRRKEAMDSLKQLKKLGRSEDEVSRDEKQVQLFTDKATQKIDSLAEAKKKELIALV